ncbi:MAG TPA: family 43 glycosylhydrolase, partial [Acidimicrobiales bacterium]|nr:family 43 glycosylhydrolase [Acidimicrobiales bacterium]
MKRGRSPGRVVVALIAVTALVPLVAFVALVATVRPVGAATPSLGDSGWSPALPNDFPDPSVLYWNGTYYGFATQSFSTGPVTNIQVATSSDGVHWTPSGIDALPVLPPWAETGDTWAPSVAYDAVDGEFVMYYTAT